MAPPGFEAGVGEFRFLSNGPVQLCLESRGSGPEHLLFVHGWISSRRIWQDLVARLDPAVCTAHLLDLRGSGRSDRPAAGHDLEGYASDVRVALEAPSRIKQLVLIASG